MPAATALPGLSLSATARMSSFGREGESGPAPGLRPPAGVTAAHAGGGVATATAAAPFPAILLHQGAAALSFVGQMGILASHMGASHTLAVRVAVGASAAVQCCIMLLLLLAPSVYWANRTWLLPTLRIMLFALPMYRRTEGGIAMMLERPAQRGAWGAASDFFRTAAGTRLLGAAVVGYVLPLPPAVMLATQAVLTGLISNSPDYCRTQLLREPLTQQRISALASWLQLVALPFLLVLPAGMQLHTAATGAFAGSQDSHAVCRATLSFVNLSLGIVGPTVVAALAWPEPSPQQTLAEEQQRQQQRQQQRDRCRRWLGAWLHGQLRRGGRATDAGLRGLAKQAALTRSLMVWHLLVVCWWGCLATVDLL